MPEEPFCSVSISESAKINEKNVEKDEMLKKTKSTTYLQGLRDNSLLILSIKVSD